MNQVLPSYGCCVALAKSSSVEHGDRGPSAMTKPLTMAMPSAATRLQPHQVHHIHHPDLQLRQVLAQQGDRGHHLQRHDSTASVSVALVPPPDRA
jgi:hypothetical protein